MNHNFELKFSIPLALQRLFLKLETSFKNGKQSVETVELTRSFGWNARDVREQHDIQVSDICF
jgi:hypothetical protein